MTDISDKAAAKYHPHKHKTSPCDTFFPLFVNFLFIIKIYMYSVGRVVLQ